MKEDVLETIAEWRDVICRVLLDRTAMRQPRAESVATNIVEALTSEFGGTHVYLPKEIARRNRERDLDIAKRYNGTLASRQALMKQYDIGQVAFYQSRRRGLKMLAQERLHRPAKGAP